MIQTFRTKNNWMKHTLWYRIINQICSPKSWIPRTKPMKLIKYQYVICVMSFNINCCYCHGLAWSYMALKWNFKYFNLGREKRGLCKLCNKRRVQNVQAAAGCRLSNVHAFSFCHESNIFTYNFRHSLCSICRRCFLMWFRDFTSHEGLIAKHVFLICKG
jgi:hypothetical protein